MRIRRRFKRTTRQYIMVALICIVVIGGAASFTSVVITGQIRDEYQTKLDKAYMDMKLNQRGVFIATTDIKSGDFITKDNVDFRTVYASQPKETYIGSEGIGKVAILDIPAGTHIQKGMLTSNTISSEFRELEYNVIHISSNIISDDTVDVRIFYPNGESYVVLSKKIVKGLIPESSTCYLWLDEEEHLRMSAAIVDAGLYPGSRLYVTKYIEPRIQEASIITYTPSLSILSLIEQNPNIVVRYSQELNKQVRKALENRLATNMENDVSAVEWEVMPDVGYVPVLPIPDLETDDDDNSSNNEMSSTQGLKTDSASSSTKHKSDLASEEEQNSSGGDDNESLSNIYKPSANNSNLYEKDDHGADLGNSNDFLYYAEEAAAKDGDTEYGE
ncbi:hypothetical protein I5677_06990 [Mobilitalea sibirica]|uniref:SAF domain-containing protein n=1 Tax=Mobilitalea sibirica TaxID=1462919 RepID=A0A8J7KVW4_9FIRM|nr:SAF domain-containing protein [Mobilitalea sibirica]MBH1940630.1 hypothetical protein [Mobilitalea sibirica]